MRSHLYLSFYFPFHFWRDVITHFHTLPHPILTRWHWQVTVGDLEKREREAGGWPAFVIVFPDCHRAPFWSHGGKCRKGEETLLWNLRLYSMNSSRSRDFRWEQIGCLNGDRMEDNVRLEELEYKNDDRERDVNGLVCVRSQIGSIYRRSLFFSISSLPLSILRLWPFLSSSFPSFIASLPLSMP